MPIPRKKSAIWSLIKQNKHYWPGLVALLILSMLSGLFRSISSSSLGKAVDMGIAHQNSQLLLYLLITLFFVLMDAARLAGFNVATARVVERMFLDIKQRVFETIAHCKLSVLQSRFSDGDLVSRVTNDLPTLSKRMADSFTWIITTFFRGLIALICCILTSWQLSLIYVIFLPILLFLSNKIGKPIEKAQLSAAKKAGNAYGIMHEMLNNNSVVKAFNAQDSMVRRFEKETTDQRHHLNQAAKKGALLTLISYFSDICLIAILFLCGGWFIITNRISIGAFVTVAALSGSIRESFDLFDRGISTLRESEAYAARINELLNLPTEPSKAFDSHSALNKETYVSSSGDAVIQIHDLCFSYKKNKPILHHVDLKIKKGQWVGIIGKSGCGKSTLVNILCGLYLDYHGKVELFGHSLSESNLDTLRKKIAVVSQDPHLFFGTVGENISYGNEKATAKQIHTAIAGARLEDLILSSSQGINTSVGDNGSKLSGGQRQRIAIARALIKDADLIILDEASSALDSKTELEIQDTLETAFRGKTVLVIAHRFSSIKNADYIYCMDEGRIVEHGSKEALLNSDSRLRQMAIRQGGLKQ